MSTGKLQQAIIDAASAELAASPALEKYYFAGKQGYAMKHGSRWIMLPQESQVKQHLLRDGIDKADMGLALCHLRMENYVDHMGPLAGYPVGIHDNVDTGGKLLVTIGPAIIESKPGSSANITRMLRTMLDDPNHPDQFKAVMGWLRQARENVITCSRRPLPVLALVGPRGCGKSLLIEIARLALGGRAACCYNALTGGQFNGGTVGAELLTIDDKAASSNNRTRTTIAQNIKAMLFAASARIESKHKDETTLRPVWAMILAVNDEAEHLGVLPVLDDSMADKISLISCRRADVEGMTREEIGEAITAEMPAFLHSLERYELPEHLRDRRTGAGAYQHPDVLAIVADISNERRLLELIRQCWGITEGGTWTGTADELQGLLAKDPTTVTSARSLLSWDKACGTYLSRLAEDGRCGIAKGGHKSGIQTYTITVPGDG